MIIVSCSEVDIEGVPGFWQPGNSVAAASREKKATAVRKVAWRVMEILRARDTGMLAVVASGCQYEPFRYSTWFAAT